MMNRVTSLGMIAALALCLLCPPPITAARDNNPKGCPLDIPTGERIDWKLEMAAWQEAKSLVGAPKRWKKPGATVRFNHYYVDDASGGIFAGFHLAPQMFLDPETGKVLACEYVIVYIPPKDEHFVYHVLVHEYLHALAGRMLHVLQRPIAENCGPMEMSMDGCEEWVQTVYPNPEGWGEDVP